MAAAFLCTAYLNARTDLIPKWGQWYAGDIDPYVTLQLRAWFRGQLPLFVHPVVATNDYVWGRGGMYTAWGLGLSLLSVPLHALARLFGATAFPDHVRFLIFYAATVALFARALHRVSRPEPQALVASAAAAGFFLVFPSYLGLIEARFLIYDQTIAVGSLWVVLLLAGVLAVLEKATATRMVVLCASAAFAVFIRPPLAAYGLTTVVLAFIVAHRGGLRGRRLLAGPLAGVVVVALYFASNKLRFGSAFDAGYANLNSGQFVDRLVRWGVDFYKVPFATQAKELYATLFRLEPFSGQNMMGTPPPAIARYATGERWREYYSPTYDSWVFAAWMISIVVVLWRLVRGRLWRGDSDLRGEVATIAGAWSLPPSIVLFVFYARVGNMVTRYIVDLYPAFVGALMCVAMAAVDEVRRRARDSTGAAQLAIASLAALYLAGWRGWTHNLSHPVDAKALDARLAEMDAHVLAPPLVPGHIRCGDWRGPDPVRAQFMGWERDCSLHSAMLFAFPYSPCISFTFGPTGKTWGPAEEKSLASFRAHADFDALRTCSTQADQETRRLTMCEPREPPFLLDGLRLYAVASLDDNFDTVDHMKLMSIDAVPSCAPTP